MSKKIYLSLIIFFCITSYAQNTRLGIDVYAGLPLSLTYFSPSISTYGGVGLKYNILKEISVNANLSLGTISGKNQSPNALLLGPTDNNNNYVSFSNNFIQYTGGLQVNLDKVFNLRRLFKRINPYLNMGGGIIHSTVSANRIDGYVRKYEGLNFYTAYVGFEIRYYYNPSIDFIVNSNFNMAQTYYNDAVPLDKKLDNYLLNSVGVSCKIGARKDKQHIEWNNVILRDRIYIPDIEKRQGQPLDAAGNFFVFHKDSIAKLQAQNIELQNKTKELEDKSKLQEAKTVELQNKAAAQQSQIDSIQNEMNSLKTTMDTLLTNRIHNSLRTMLDTMQMPKNVFAPEESPKQKDGKPVSQVGSKEQQRQIESLKRDNQVLKSKVDDLQKQINELKKNPELRNTAPKDSEKNKAVPTPEVKLNQDAVNNVKAIATESKTVESNSTMPTNSLTDGLNKIDNVVPPVAKYNIIAGAYAGEKYANIFRDKMRARGYSAAVFKSDVNSKILRVCIFTSEDRSEALSVLRKARTSVDPKAWIHVYYQK